jgi:hypothetical protein
LANNTQRGGLLGMAGVLTVSADGVNTSPVTRGVWVLENILGTPPPTPPDGVPALESDVSGATTIRERLARHREDKACFVCHRMIDPLGFPLENFDPIGRWRTEYAKPKGKAPAPKIDPSGELPSGEKYASFADFKKTLLTSRRDLFVRTFAEKLLAYATGRHMVAIDQYDVDDILKRAQGHNYGVRSMVVEALTSKIFRSR